MVMWAIPGEPEQEESIRLFAPAGEAPTAPQAEEEPPLWVAAAGLEAKLRRRRSGNQQDHMDLTRLDNADGTGFLSHLLAAFPRPGPPGSLQKPFGFTG